MILQKRMFMPMKKIIILFIIFLFGFLGGIVSKYYYDIFTYYNDTRIFGSKDNGLLDEINVIPDEKTALKIAKAVWLPIYGGKSLFMYSYKIELVEENIWGIKGVNRIYRFIGANYGGPYIFIDRKTGAILQVGHGGDDPIGYKRGDAKTTATNFEEMR